MHACICDFILDCLQNSIEAKATSVILRLAEDPGAVTVEIRDNGIGMTEDECKRAIDPFYTNGLKHAERKVGLGLPFMIQTVEQTDGDWSLDSTAGRGTVLRFSFNRGHVDTPPTGDVSGMLLQAIMFDGEFELEFERILGLNGKTDSYRIKRSEMKAVLGDLNDADSLILARQFLRSQEEGLLEGER